MNMIIQMVHAILLVATATIAICIATVCLYVVVIAMQSVIEEHRKKKGNKKNGTKE